jgi:hypothetical protein
MGNFELDNNVSCVLVGHHLAKKVLRMSSEILQPYWLGKIYEF